MAEENKDNGSFTDLLASGAVAGGSALVDFASKGLGNMWNSFFGDSSKKKQKALMHYQDVINQKALTESPSSMRAGFESAGFSPALALGASSPSVGLGSSQMGNVSANEPFSDTLTKREQRNLIRKQATLASIQKYTDIADSLGKNAEQLEKAGINVSDTYKRIVDLLGLNDVFVKKSGDNGKPMFRASEQAKIDKDVADTGLAKEKTNTEKTAQELNKASANLTNEKVNTEYTIQDLNIAQARLAEEKADTEKNVRRELDSRASLQHWQKKEIMETFDLLWTKMNETIINIQEQTKLFTAQMNDASVSSQIKEQALEVEKAYNQFKKEMSDVGINLLTESDKDMAVIKKYKDEGHYGRLALYYLHKILNIFNAGAAVTKVVK